MEAEKQLAFLQNMTHLALTHAASTPNVPTPEGKMSHDKMLSFVQNMAKSGMPQMMASGGPITTAGGIGGAIGNLLGSQNQFQAQGAPVQAGTNATQLNNAYNGAQNGLGAQQNLVNNLQGGVAQGANTQGNLTQQLTAQANGQGPNPALAELNQQTGQNIAQQAALAAGQRGAGANAGLLARENAQQGAATQQNAVGQAATLGAQQQLAAESNLQNLAGAQVAQGQGAVQGLNNAQQNEQNILQGANTSLNNANVAQQSNINNVNAQVAAGNQSQNGNVLSGVGNGLSTLFSAGAGLFGFAHGGVVKMDAGGKVLDANARKHIAPHNFALPNGRYPIHDLSHARNALARVAQNGSPEEKAKVRAAVHKKYPSIKSACNGAYMADGGMAHPAMMASGGVSGQAVNGPQSFVGNWLNSSVNSSGPSVAATPTINANPASPFQKPQGGGGAPKKETADDGEMDDSDPNLNITQPIQELPMQGLGVGDLSQPYNPDPMNITAPQNLGQAPQISASQIPTPEDAGPFNITIPNAYKGGLMKDGGKVKSDGPGEKAVKKGDSLDNDKIPTMLSQGELVVDRDTLANPGPIGQMARALAQHIAQKNKSNKGKK